MSNTEPPVPAQNYMQRVGKSSCVRCDFETDATASFEDQDAAMMAHLAEKHPGWMTDGGKSILKDRLAKNPLGTEQPGIPEDYDDVTAQINAAESVYRKLVDKHPRSQILFWALEFLAARGRIARLTSDLAAANLRVEGLEKEVEEAKAGESFQSGILWNAYQAAGRTDLTLSGWLNFLVAENAALKARVEQLSKPVTDEEMQKHALHCMMLGTLNQINDWRVLTSTQVDAIIRARSERELREKQRRQP